MSAEQRPPRRGALALCGRKSLGLILVDAPRPVGYTTEPAWTGVHLSAKIAPVGSPWASRNPEVIGYVDEQRIDHLLGLLPTEAKVRSDKIAVHVQPSPRGRGRDVTRLAQEDLLADKFLSVNRLETIYLWLRSAVICLRSKMPDQPGSCRSTVQMVYADLEERAVMGAAKYGERLRAFNGRDSRLDLYQELLDALVYVRQIIEETEVKAFGDS